MQKYPSMLLHEQQMWSVDTSILLAKKIFKSNLNLNQRKK